MRSRFSPAPARANEAGRCSPGVSPLEFSPRRSGYDLSPRPSAPRRDPRKQSVRGDSSRSLRSQALKPRVQPLASGLRMQEDPIEASCRRPFDPARRLRPTSPPFGSDPRLLSTFFPAPPRGTARVILEDAVNDRQPTLALSDQHGGAWPLARRLAPRAPPFRVSPWWTLLLRGRSTLLGFCPLSCCLDRSNAAVALA